MLIHYMYASMRRNAHAYHPFISARHNKPEPKFIYIYFNIVMCDFTDTRERRDRQDVLRSNS